MAKQIKVTAEHIKNGVRSMYTLCPIALAVKAAVPEIDHACVTRECVWIGYDSIGRDLHECRYDLPQRAKTFISRFDNGAKVRPFIFTLAGLE